MKKKLQCRPHETVQQHLVGGCFSVYERLFAKGGGGCMGAAHVGGKTTHNTKKPQPTFAAAVDILPYYAKKLSRSLDERGFVLSFCGLGRSFRNGCSFFPIFPARRIHKNSLKRQLVNEIYYCHRYALCCFSYAFPIRTFSSVTHAHTHTHFWVGKTTRIMTPGALDFHSPAGQRGSNRTGGRPASYR